MNSVTTIESTMTGSNGFELYVPVGRLGELMFDGNGSNVIQLSRIPSELPEAKSFDVSEKTTPGAYKLEPGRHLVEVTTFDSEFDLYLGLV